MRRPEEARPTDCAPEKAFLFGHLLGYKEPPDRCADCAMRGRIAALLGGSIVSSPKEQLNLTAPAEEYVNNQGTGVEIEEEASPRSADPEPWDPEKIRIHTKHYSLRQIVDMIRDGDLDLAPDFQRDYVWKDSQKWGLIESLLLGIPIPSFYFNEDAFGRMQVVDGVQRLTTIYAFVQEGGFKLGALTYLGDLMGKGFSDLDPVFRRRLLSSQFVAHVIDPQTPYRAKFDIFRRINTGGSPLSAQEIRHCMSSERSRGLLKRLATAPAFLDATGGSLENHPRMADREVVLRFVAYCLADVGEYESSGGLDAFLGTITSKLDDERATSDEKLAELEEVFTLAMRNAKAVFGEHAFRFWARGSERRNPINRALFETWGTTLAKYPAPLVTEKADVLMNLARDLMTDDQEFIGASTGSTGDVASVRLRFDKVRNLVAEVLG